MYLKTATAAQNTQHSTNEPAQATTVAACGVMYS